MTRKRTNGARRGAATDMGRAARSLSWRIASSLTARCLVVAGVYAVVVALAVFTVSGISDAHVSNAFVSDAEFDEVVQDVINDDYSAFAESRFAGMEVLVLDGAGEPLYASSTRFAKAISKDDLAFINEEDWNARYSVYEEDRDGETMYRVLWLNGIDDAGFETVAGYALLDRELNIVEGTLFEGRASITPEQFGLLNGVIEFPGTEAATHGTDGSDDYPFNMILQDGQYVISRTEGVNDAGETRTIVKAVPVINNSDYDRVFAESQGIMLILVPVIGVATILLFVAEARLIRSSTRPLVSAIAGYGKARRVDLDLDKVASELVPIYDGFVDLTRHLERAQADKQRMIADISHDIKTPLTAIRGYAQAFRDGMVPPDKTAEYARALCAKAEAATSMVETLGEYAASEHPEYRCERVSCDLSQMLESFCGDIAPMVEQRGNALEVDVSAGPIAVAIDAELVRRALTNLINNACVHNPAGTRVRVCCSRERTPDGRPIARVLVCDDGQGIDPELARNIFDPFVTSNAARTIGGGTGLGLSIARRFIELNAGVLSLRTPAPEPWSTCFEITLPCE